MEIPTAQGGVSVWSIQTGDTVYIAARLNDSTFYWGDDFVISLDPLGDRTPGPGHDDTQWYFRRVLDSSVVNRGRHGRWMAPSDDPDWRLGKERGGEGWEVRSSSDATGNLGSSCRCSGSPMTRDGGDDRVPELRRLTACVVCLAGAAVRGAADEGGDDPGAMGDGGGGGSIRRVRRVGLRRVPEDLPCVGGERGRWQFVHQPTELLALDHECDAIILRDRLAAFLREEARIDSGVDAQLEVKMRTRGEADDPTAPITAPRAPTCATGVRGDGAQVTVASHDAVRMTNLTIRP